MIAQIGDGIFFSGSAFGCYHLKLWRFNLYWDRIGAEKTLILCACWQSAGMAQPPSRSNAGISFTRRN